MVLKESKINIDESKHFRKCRFWKSSAQYNKTPQMVNNCNQPEAPDDNTFKHNNYWAKNNPKFSNIAVFSRPSSTQTRFFK